MESRPSKSFACPHCGANTTWEKPGYGAIIGADLLASIIAIPFVAFGAIGFVVAVCGLMFAFLYWLNRSTTCLSCGKRISLAQAHSGGGP